MSQQRSRVALCGGPRLFRESFARALAKDPTLDVVGACDLAGAADLCRRERPAVVILDSADGDTAADLCSTVKDVSGDTRVVLLSDDGTTDHLVEAVEAGADGFAVRSSTLDDLVRAVREVAAGTAHVPAELLGPLLRRLIDRRREEDAVVDKLRLLTAREAEVLALLVDGAGREVIAATLYISAETARTHVQRVLGKLGAHSQREAVAMVVGSASARRLLAKAVPA